MTATEKRQCSAFAEPTGNYAAPRHHCQKPAIVERDGKLFCRIHDPEYIRAKSQKFQEKLDKEQAEYREIYNRNLALLAATEGLSTEELKALTPALLRKAIPMRDALEAVQQKTHCGHFGYGNILTDPQNDRKHTYADLVKEILAQAKEGEKHD